MAKSENSMLSEVVEREATCDCHWNKVQALAVAKAVAEKCAQIVEDRLARMPPDPNRTEYAKAQVYSLHETLTAIRALSAPRPEGSSKRSDELTDEQCRFLLDECFKPVSDWPDEDLQALSEHDPDPPDDSHKGLVRKLAAEVLRLRRAEGSEGR